MHLLGTSRTGSMVISPLRFLMVPKYVMGSVSNMELDGTGTKPRSFSSLLRDGVRLGREIESSELGDLRFLVSPTTKDWLRW